MTTRHSFLLACAQDDNEEDDEATVEDALAVPVSSPAILPKKKTAKKAPAGKAEWVGDVNSTGNGAKFYRCERGCRCDGVPSCMPVENIQAWLRCR